MQSESNLNYFSLHPVSNLSPVSTLFLITVDDFDHTNLQLLHGSVAWSRDEKGRYTRNEIAITHTTEPQVNIITGEKEVPLISYPGRKLEYFEPLFDLLEELRKHLNDPNLKYIFVIGYSFRDDQ
jgi:hypothetical protein